MIKTNTAITIMKPGAIIPTDTVEKVIYGKITEIIYSLELGGINVSYVYYEPIVRSEGTEFEFTEEMYIESGSKFFTFDEAQTIKDTLTIPEGLSEKEEILFKYKEAFKLKMSERFNILPSDIVDSL